MAGYLDPRVTQDPKIYLNDTGILRNLMGITVDRLLVVVNIVRGTRKTSSSSCGSSQLRRLRKEEAAALPRRCSLCARLGKSLFHGSSRLIYLHPSLSPSMTGAAMSKRLLWTPMRMPTL